MSWVWAIFFRPGPNLGQNEWARPMVGQTPKMTLYKARARPGRAGPRPKLIPRAYVHQITFSVILKRGLHTTTFFNQWPWHNFWCFWHIFCKKVEWKAPVRKIQNNLPSLHTIVCWKVKQKILSEFFMPPNHFEYIRHSVLHVNKKSCESVAKL